MDIDTRHFGKITIKDEDIIDFPEGIPGFEDTKKFVLLDDGDKSSPFRWLQGVDNPELALVLIDPRYFKPDYLVDVNDADVEILDIKDIDKVLVYSIVVIPEDVSKMTANLKAPVLINTENRTGKQVVTENNDYKVRHYIMEELKLIGGQV